MTLQEWEEKTGEHTFRALEFGTKGSSTARFIYYGVNPNRRELWHLSDWRVTSVSGGTIWLMPK